MSFGYFLGLEVWGLRGVFSDASSFFSGNKINLLKPKNNTKYDKFKRYGYDHKELQSKGKRHMQAV